MDVQQNIDNEKLPFICAACSKSFFVKSHLNDHLYSHIKGSVLINEICCKGFSEIFELNEFFRNYMIKDSWTCDTCHGSFLTKSDLTEHLSGHLYHSHFCKLCCKAFDDKESLNAHNHEKHADLSICEFCDAVFTVARSLVRHLSTFHKVENPYTCIRCMEKFPDAIALRNHRKIHKKGVSCEVCKKKFDCNYRLKLHLRTHTKEMPYSCENCNKKFRFKRSLDLHILVHNKDKLDQVVNVPE